MGEGKRDDWKSNVVVRGADYAAGARRAPYVPSVPIVKHIASPPEPPAVGVTAQQILELLRQFTKEQQK
jgi:hypothetical protein